MSEKPTNKQMYKAAHIIVALGVSFPKEHTKKAYIDFIGKYADDFDKAPLPNHHVYHEVDEVYRALRKMENAEKVDITVNGVKWSFRIGECYYEMKADYQTRTHRPDYSDWIRGLDNERTYEDLVGYSVSREYYGYNFYGLNERYQTVKECEEAYRKREEEKASKKAREEAEENKIRSLTCAAL